MRKKNEIEAEGREFAKICSNSERSEQFWVTECFFNWFWRLELEFKLEKKWDLETCRKS